VVEHSHNGIDFSSVGDLRGGGTTNLVQAYNFTHKNPVAGENYYRIQQVDFDGRDDRSNIATVWFNNDQQIIIYPNPATSTISVNSPKETLATIKNYLGKSLKTMILSEGENEILLDELSQGMYLLQFENGGVETFIKQ